MLISTTVLIGGSIATAIGWGLAKVYENLPEEDQSMIENHPIVETIVASAKDSATTLVDGITKGTNDYIQKIK